MLIVATIYGIIGMIHASAAMCVFKDEGMLDVWDGTATRFLVLTAVATIVLFTWPIWLGAYLSRFI